MSILKQLKRRISRSVFPAPLALLLAFSVFWANPFPPGALAATLTVNTLADNQIAGDGFCTLREAIQAANADADFNDCSGTDYGNDAITFSVTGTIRLGSELPVISGGGSSLTISGPGADQLTVSGDSDGNGSGDVRVIAVNGLANFKLEKMTIADGFSTGNGAGVLVEVAGNFYALNCVFSRNRGTQGGGLYTTALQNKVSDCLFTGNYAALGGAFTVTTNLNLEHCILTNNQASQNGGGGSLINANGFLTKNTFSNNQALLGGGSYQEGGNLNASQNTFSGNHATEGGGIYAMGGNLNLTECAFTQNIAISQGGGIRTGDNFLASRCTFENNQADDGGALRTVNNVTLLNSTLSNNQAHSQGGGILSLGNTFINNSTFYGNEALDGGGIKNGDPAKFPAIKNTIIAGSTSGGNCSGLVSASNYGNNIDSGDTCKWGSDKGSMSNTDPALANLAHNGGPTKTMALKPGSPAINGVTYTPPNGCPATDQRGVTRPQEEVCDIGAFEFFWRYIYLPITLK